MPERGGMSIINKQIVADIEIFYVPGRFISGLLKSSENPVMRLKWRNHGGINDPGIARLKYPLQLSPDH